MIVGFGRLSDDKGTYVKRKVAVQFNDESVRKKEKKLLVRFMKSPNLREFFGFFQ